MIITGGLSFAGNRINHATIQGRNAMHHTIVDLSQNIDLDSGGSGSVVNVKWIELAKSAIWNSGGNGVTLNITGNISHQGSAIQLTSGDIFNATQPGTNISGFGGAGEGIRLSAVESNVIGDMDLPIMFWRNDGIDMGNKINWQYVNAQGGGGNAGYTLRILSNPTIIKADNITVNNTDSTRYGGLYIDDVTNT